MKTVLELQEELETIKILRGDEHDQVVACLDQIGTAYFANEENNKALEYYEKALNMLKELYPDEDINSNELSLDIQYRIGKVYEAKAALNDRFNSNRDVSFQKVLSNRELFDADPNNERDDSQRSTEDMDSTLIYSDMAEEARTAGNLDAAEPLYLKSIQLRRKKFGNSHPALSPVLVNYSELLRQKNQFEEAIIVLEEALSINLTAHGRLHGNVALILNNIGQIHKFMNNLTLSEKFLLESLTLRREIYGELNVHVAGSLNNLGELYREKLDFFKAIHYHKLAIEAFEKTVGPTHPGTVNAKGNYGITLRRYAGVNASEGEAILKDTVEYLHQNSYDEHHPWLVKFTQEHMVTQAQKLATQGKHEESLEIYDSVLKKKQNLAALPVPLNNVNQLQVRPQSPIAETQDLFIIARGKFVSMVGKARSLLQKARFSELDAILDECSFFPRAQLGAGEEGEVCWIDYQLVIAQYQHFKSDYTTANESFVGALQAKIDVYGPDHLSLVEIMVGLAENYRAQGIYADAETFLTQAMKLVDLQYKQDFQNIGKATISTCLLYLTAIIAMAELHRNQGSYSVAVPLLQQAYDISIENNLGEESVQGELFTSLAALEKAKSCFEKAKELHKSALDIRAKCFGAQHPKTLSSQFHLAEIEFLSSQYLVAERHVEEVLQVRLTFFGGCEQGHPAVAAAYHLKGRVMLALHRLNEAEECFEKAQEMRRIKFSPLRRSDVMDKLKTRQELAAELQQQQLLTGETEQQAWANHPAIAQSLSAKATLLREKREFNESMEVYETALKMYRYCFPSTPQHNGVCDVMVGIALHFVARFQYLAALPLLEECIRLRSQYMSELGSLQYHLALVEIYLEYGHILLRCGRADEALVAIGQSGIHAYNTVRHPSSLHTADCLYLLALHSRHQARYKDAKYQYSLCMALRYRELGAGHPKVLEVLYGAADNMREVGFFHDALDAVSVLEALAKKHFGEGSLQDAIATLLHANILCDRQKSIKADAAYSVALPIITNILGERNPYMLDILLGQARCLQQEAKFVPADKLFKDALDLAHQLYGENNHCSMDILSSIHFLRINNKPAEVLSASNALKDEVLVYYTEKFGDKHPFTSHAKGRLGVIQNVLKKDSGRRLLKDARQAFDDVKQFPYTADHPWLLEIGGYEKSAAKERMSSSIEELSLALWAMPAFEGDLSYGKMPKNIWIDLENNFPEAWGKVHYFGTAATSAVAVVRPRSPGSSFAGLGVELSPARSRSAKKSAANVSADFTAGGGGVSTTAVEAEVKARKEAEDNLVNEQHLRKEVEETLEREQAAKKELDEKLAVEMEERRQLEIKIAAMMQELLETKAAREAAEAAAAAAQEAAAELAAEKEALAAQAQREAEEAMKLFTEAPAPVVEAVPEVEPPPSFPTADDLNAASAETAAAAAEAPVEVPLVDQLMGAAQVFVEPAPTVITDPVVIAALQAAEFLLQRAKELQSQGWYLKAQPLFEECLLVRETHIPQDAVTIDALYCYALNLQFMFDLHKAELKLALCLAGRERLTSVRSEPVAQIMIAQANNYMLQGRLIESTTRFAEASKLLTEITDSSVNSLYGECLCWQSANALKLGKMLESKAMNDRSNAILSKKTALNNIMITNGLLIKCEQLRINCKYREAQNVIEQTLIYRKRVMGESHPAIADCLVLMGACFMENGKPYEAEPKLQQAMAIRLKYFDKSDLRVVEVDFYMAKLHIQFSRLYEGIELFKSVLAARQRVYLTSDHVEVSDVLYCLGDAYLKLGKFSEAEEHLNEALRIRQLNLPETLDSHPKIAEVKGKLGELNRQLGNYTQAKINLEESLEERKLLFNKEHPEYLTAQLEYALVLMNCDDYVNAEKLLKRTIKHRAAALSTDHPDYAYSLVCMCELLRLTNRLEEIDPLLSEAVKTSRLLYQKDDSGAGFAASSVNAEESKGPTAEEEGSNALLQSSVPLIECYILEANLRLAQLENVNNAPPEDLHTEEEEEEEEVVVLERNTVRTPGDLRSIGSSTSLGSGGTAAEGKEQQEGQTEGEGDAPAAETEEHEDDENENEEEQEEGEEGAAGDCDELLQMLAAIPQIPVPVFKNQMYLDLVAEYERILGLLKPVLIRPELGITSHPLIVHVEANIGVVKLYEYLAKNKFFERLTDSEKEAFKQEENRKKKQAKEIITKPVGILMMEKCVDVFLSHFLFNVSHCWILKYKVIMNSVVFTLDDMELANNYFIEAEELRKTGKFYDADVKYDTVFLTQIMYLGPLSASTNIAIADTLYSKAENCRMMGQLELSNVLYTQSITIYRKRQGNESEGVIKGIIGMTELLISQGLFEDSFAMHQRILPTVVSLFGEESVQVARVKSSLTRDLLYLYKFDKAMSMATEALLLFNGIKDAGKRDPEDLIGLHVTIAYIYLGQGMFPLAKESIESAQLIVDKAYPNDPEHHCSVDVMQCRVEYLFIINKIQEAYKLSAKVLAYRIKAYGRSAGAAEFLKAGTNATANAAKKTAFYEAFDTLSMESSRQEHEDEKRANKAAGLKTSRKNNKPKASSKQEAEDLELEMEMSLTSAELRDDFKNQPNAVLPEGVAAANVEGGDGAAVNDTAPVLATAGPTAKKSASVNYTSVSKFSKPDNSAPAYLFKNRPITAHPIIAHCLNQRGRIAIALFDMEEARSVLDGSAAMMAKLYSKPSILKLSTAFEQTNLIFWKGNFEEAKSNHSNVLHQRLQLCEEDHSDKSDSLFAIANINILLSRYDDSTQMLANALSVREKVFGDSHWKMAEIYNACAQVLHDKGLYAESDAMYDKSLFILHKQFGELHLLIAAVLVGQAQNARELGLYEQASSYLEQSISMRSVLIGENHPLTAECHFHLSGVRRWQGKILEAKKSLDEAIVVQRDNLGKYHGMTVMTLLALAHNFTDLAKYSTAEHVFNRANQLLRKTLGKDHIILAQGMTGLAENFKCTGFLEKSQELHEKALYLRRKILGERHELVAESLFFLAELKFVHAKYDDAAKGYDDALAIQKLALGENHLIVTNTMCSLGKVLLAQGKIADAKFQFDRAYYLRKQQLNSDHPALGDSQFLIAQISRRMGKLDQSNALFERCLNTVRDARGARHPLVATILSNLAEVNNVSGRYVYAKELLLESLQIRMNLFKDINENHPDITESFFGLAENMRYTGRYTTIKISESERFFSKKLTAGKSGMGLQLETVDESNSAASTSRISEDHRSTAEKPGAAGKEAEEEEEPIDSLGEALLTGTLPSGSLLPEENGSSTAALTNNAVVNSVTTASLPASDSLPPPPTSTSGIGSAGMEGVPTAVLEDDDISAPTVEMSAIEQLDTDSHAGSTADDHSHVGKTALEERDALEEMGLFKAMPLYEKVLDSLLTVFSDTHPLVIQTKFAMAEVQRVIGQYDKAFTMFEAILNQRRTLYGDTHPDTVSSMLAMGEVLRNMQRIFPDTPSGSIDSKTIRQSKNAIPVGVRLVEHFGSLIRPNTAVKYVPPDVNYDEEEDLNKPLPGTAAYNHKLPSKKDPRWKFLSEPELAKKKKEVIKIQKGYMGYQFPANPKGPRPESTPNSSSNIARPQKVFANDAKWLFDMGLNLQKKLFGDGADHPVSAAILFAKGELYRARRDYPLALKDFEKSLAMRRKLFRGNHPLIADCLNSMAEVFRIEGKYNQAAPLFEKALEIRQEAYGGVSHPSIADVKNNTAMLYFSQGKYAEAQKLFEEALSICEELLGAAHPSTALCLNNLAGLMQATGQYKLALVMFQQTLRIKQQAYGETHPDVASTLNNIGLLMKAQNKLDEAQSYYQRALDMQQKVYGMSHPDVATSMNNLAAVYVLVGKRREAKELYQNSITIRSALFGVDHPSVASTKNNYGALLFAMAEYEDARNIFEDSLRIRRMVLGEEHPAIAESLNNIGLLLYTQGAWKDAVPLYERALQIKVNAFGSAETPSVATSMNNLAALHHRLGNFEAAVDLYQQAYEVRLKTLGSNHADTKATLSNLSAVEKDQQRAKTKANSKMSGGSGSFGQMNSGSYVGGEKEEEDFGEPMMSSVFESNGVEELSGL